MKNRIWELDAIRGICILGMVAVHLVYDLVELFAIVQWEYPAVFVLLRDWGGVLFFLLSGICVTLGSRPIRRGITVFLCGMLCTAVTALMAWLGLADESIVIYFGVLHCLGICMLLWPVLQKLPIVPLAVLGLALSAAGLYLLFSVRVSFSWLIPLGLFPASFLSSDYFPLLPYLGFFLLGAVVGKTVYRQKKTLLPLPGKTPAVIQFLTFCGRQSLLVYLLHQPVLAALIWALSSILQGGGLQ